MSMTNGIVLCTGCDYLERVVHRPITLIYQLPDGSIFTTSRNFGWCNSCCAVRDNESEFDFQINNPNIHQLTEKTKGFFYFFRNLVNRVLGGNSGEFDELKNLRVALRIASGRKSHSRCLNCGQDDVKSLGQIVHHCGGSLYFGKGDPDAPRFSYKPEVIFLDMEGRVGQLQSPEEWADHLGKYSIIEGVLDRGLFSGFLIHIPMSHKEL